MRNALKVHLVLRVGLHAQADCEDKLANGSREAREESVERLEIAMSRQLMCHISPNATNQIAQHPPLPHHYR